MYSHILGSPPFAVLSFSALIQRREEPSTGYQLTMSARTPKDVELSGDIDFIKTPAAKPSEFETGEDCGIALTNVSPCRC